MNYPRSFAFKISSFDFLQGVFVVPVGSIWYRAYNKEAPLLTDTPSFFGDMEVAFFNAHQAQRDIGEFQSKKQLRLLDMRYVMAILPYVLQHASTSTDVISKVMMALGIVTFQKQIDILETLSVAEYPWIPDYIQRMKQFQSLKVKPLWANHVELQGVRIGITNIDYEVMSWLKALLYPIVDGIIAPALNTPFHDQGDADVTKSVMYQELILFHPKEQLEYIGDRPRTSRVQYYHMTIPFQEAFVNLEARNSLTPSNGRIRYRGGSGVKIPMIKDEMGDRIAIDVTTKKRYKAWVQSWMPEIRVLHKKCPWLKKAMVCIPLATPE